MAQTIPDESHLDRSLPFLLQGYRFIPNRCDRYGSHIVRSRLMLRKVTLIRGPEAATMFYTPGHFTRAGAMPTPTVKLLQDFGSVQALDGEAHRHRKSLFIELLKLQEAEPLGRMIGEALQRRWERTGPGAPFTLFDEARYAIMEALCDWAGIPISPAEMQRRTEQLSRAVGDAGHFGPSNWRALIERSRLEDWARGLIQGVRDGSLTVPADRALGKIAAWRDQSGELLDLPSAGVELINILRPSVAAAWYVAHLGKAVHEHGPPQDGSEDVLDAYVQEVRRLTPFFPAIGGRAKPGAALGGYQFEEGEWVLLDLYGTNRDPRAFDAPATFCATRFLERSTQDPGFVPQGGGDATVSHRCPGEGVTVAILKRVLQLLAFKLDYSVPPQDLTVRLSQMPARPRSGFVMLKRHA